MRRHIIVGDIHGCFDELNALLSKLDVSRDDVVVAVGDLTRKGPAPDRCVELWKERGYRTVLGNNDAKMLEWRRPALFTSRSDRRILRRKDLLKEIGRWPLMIDLPEIGAAVVHAGILPNGDHPRDAALELRYIRRSGERWEMVPKGKEKPADRFWSEVWDGNRFIVYGHTPRPKAKVDHRAIGLDTGCVYGGKLTALVFDRPGEWRLFDVPARKQYAR